MSDLKETKLSSTNVYKGAFLDVRRDEVTLPDGKTSIREWINHPGAVCIIPILPNGDIALIRQYRYPIKKEMIELPAGKLDVGESPNECALRELEEEIGYSATNLSFLTIIHPAIGFANEEMHLYIATDLVKTQSHLDRDEFLIVKPTPLKKAMNMVWNGQITDVKTIIGLHWANKILSS
jgi:ADP-ribose pyrophosphatase